MVFLACHMPSWGVLKKIPHDARFTFEQINQMLCLQFDLALAVKEGVRRELVKQAETDIRTVLHESIAKMPGVDIHRTRPSDCDICGIIEVVKKRAHLNFVKRPSSIIQFSPHFSMRVPTRADSFLRHCSRTVLAS